MVWCHVCKILKRLYNGFLLFSVPYFILELILSNKYEIDDIEGRLMANSWCTRNNDSSPTTMDNIHKSTWSTCGTITFFYKYPSPPELVEFISGTGKKNMKILSSPSTFGRMIRCWYWQINRLQFRLITRNNFVCRHIHRVYDFSSHRFLNATTNET